MARRQAGGATVEAPSAPSTGPAQHPVVPPSWPAPQGGHAPAPTTPTAPAAGRGAERPGAPAGAGPRAATQGRPPAAAQGHPPLAVGANGLPHFSAYIRQTDLGDVEMDDRFAVLPDDLYVEGEIKSCEFEQGDRGLRLVIRHGLTYPNEHRGVTIKDWVTLPDEILHEGQQLNAIKKRWKMFLDACELLSPDGRTPLAESPADFVGQIVGFRTKNKDQQKVLDTGEIKIVTYTNVGFGYYRAEKTEGLVSSGETVPVVSAAWAPQG